MPAGEAGQSAEDGLDAAQPPERDAHNHDDVARSPAHAHGATEPATPAHEAAAAAASAAKQRKLENKLTQKRLRDRQKEKLLIAETKVVELTSRLQQLRTQQKGWQGQEAESEPPRLDEQTRSFLVDRLHLAQELVLTVDQAAPPLAVTAQQLLDLPLERTRELWRMYMRAFAEQLQLWAGDPHSPAALRLSRVYWEAAQVWMTLHNCPRLFQGAPQLSSRLGTRHVALQEDLTPGEHHQRLLAAARLSAEQKAVLCALRVPLYTNFGRLQAQRAAAIIKLQALVPSAAEQLLEHGGAQSGDAPQTADAASVISHLKAILQEEQCQYSLAISIMWTRVLTCFQGALMKVLAWPSNVGIFGISELVAREAGEPTVQELLRRGTLDVDGHLLPLETAVPPTMPVQRVPPSDAGLATGLPHGIGMASPGA